ncbi:MAG: hypothetical protein WDW36_009361 [Sanguina aurantia]
MGARRVRGAARVDRPPRLLCHRGGGEVQLRTRRRSSLLAGHAAGHGTAPAGVSRRTAALDTTGSYINNPTSAHPETPLFLQRNIAAVINDPAAWTAHGKLHEGHVGGPSDEALLAALRQVAITNGLECKVGVMNTKVGAARAPVGAELAVTNGAVGCGLEEVRALPVALSGSSQRHRGCARGSGPPAGGCGCVSAHTHPVRAAPPSLSSVLPSIPAAASHQRHPSSGIPAAAAAAAVVRACEAPNRTVDPLVLAGAPSPGQSTRHMPVDTCEGAFAGALSGLVTPGSRSAPAAHPPDHPMMLHPARSDDRRVSALHTHPPTHHQPDHCNPCCPPLSRQISYVLDTEDVMGRRHRRKQRAAQGEGTSSSSPDNKLGRFPAAMGGAVMGVLRLLDGGAAAAPGAMPVEANGGAANGVVPLADATQALLQAILPDV